MNSPLPHKIHLTWSIDKAFQINLQFQTNTSTKWLVSKITPIHKKGPKQIIENYRTIANLCSTSKIFERLILIHILDLEFQNKTGITGKQQHGFKQKIFNVINCGASYSASMSLFLLEIIKNQTHLPLFLYKMQLV